MSTATALHRVRGFVPETLLVLGILYLFAVGGVCVQAAASLGLATLDGAVALLG